MQPGIQNPALNVNTNIEALSKMHQQTQIETTQQSIAIGLDGYYGEYVICNMTHNPIIAIDKSNKRAVIEPCVDNTHRGVVEIIQRHINGTRVNKKSVPLREVSIPTTVTRIPGWSIEQGPVHTSLGIVLTNMTIGETFTHPESEKDYVEEVYTAVADIIEDDATATTRFFINDPQARHDMVYGAIGSSVFEISLTHLPNETGTAVMTVIISSNNKTYIQASFDIEELFTTGKWCQDNETVNIGLGLTAQEALDAVRHNLKLFESRIFEATNARMILEREQHTSKSEASANKIGSLQKHIKEHTAHYKTEAEKHKSELNAAQAKSDEWKRMYDATSERFVVEEKRMAEESKRREQDYREQKAREAAKAESMKYWFTTVKLVGGFIIGVAVPYIIKNIKDAKE